MSDTDHCWCCMCGARFTEKEIEGATACPKCGDPGLPCDAKQDLSVNVNWHELRILGIWAENWAQRCQDKNPGGAGEARPEVVHAIARRLQSQHPTLTPLTLSGEIMQLKDRGYGVETIGVAKTGPIPVNGPGGTKV